MSTGLFPTTAGDQKRRGVSTTRVVVGKRSYRGATMGAAVAAMEREDRCPACGWSLVACECSVGDVREALRDAQAKNREYRDRIEEFIEHGPPPDGSRRYLAVWSALAATVRR